MPFKYYHLNMPMLLIVLAVFFQSTSVTGQSNQKTPIDFNLNHFYISIDSTTFHALLDHPEMLTNYFEADSGMPEFNSVNDSTGIIYLRGKTVYMELMGPKNKFGVPEGMTGFGFSEDTQLPLDPLWENQIDSLFKGMGAKFGNNKHKTSNSKSINWFDTAYIPDSTTKTHTWYSRFNPEFLSEITGKEYDTYTREAYLSLTRTGEKKVQNITGITLELNKKDFDRISEEFNRLQVLKTEQGSKGNSYMLGDVEIVLRESDTSKLLMVKFQMIGNSNCNCKVGNIEFTCHDDELKMHFLSNME
ncbi:DUF5829 family protein [Belliella marina]|uniref:DUF5829 family protein n=1 Tax=Belliella marina TaxID=1644146 RepID=A0ABW4VNN5_9BACT